MIKIKYYDAFEGVILLLYATPFENDNRLVVVSLNVSKNKPMVERISRQPSTRFILVDIKTGLAYCYGKTLGDIQDKYKAQIEQYEKLIKSDKYKAQKKKYKGR